MPRKRYNETPPVSIRFGAIRADLDARCDGSLPGYRRTITRDLIRYYAMLDAAMQGYTPLSAHDALALYADHLHGKADEPTPILDALERARVLVDIANLPIADALVMVGLVKEES